MWKLNKTIEIDAAHRLPDHPGKCRNPHGHRWRFDIEIATEVLNLDGMVVDFGDLKELIHSLDHQDINGIPPFNETPPTAENLSRWAVEAIRPLVPEADRVTVTVFETPSASVSYSWCSAMQAFERGPK